MSSKLIWFMADTATTSRRGSPMISFSCAIVSCEMAAELLCASLSSSNPIPLAVRMSSSRCRVKFFWENIRLTLASDMSILLASSP